ncbi:hypothetical protein [Glaciecola petra]|uniref:Uncharacterized protein n=1 Tax=Glaciecola petra TaxID=3075602 RepID=A0ABU2ZRR4_9ALTE|nr:hypothetical protein [Aestuariibacter sp. P117]MDT0594713.1 hypothetical protein [Aestuariibacter sp. P117]
MFTLGLILSFVLCTWYFLVQTVKYGMAKKRWVFAGLVFGPMILPMFQMSKRMAVRKAVGFNSAYFQA